MSNLDHIILYLILFGISFVWSKTNISNRKQIGIVFAIMYIFVVGSRTWGPDYEWYRYKVDNPNNWIIKEDEIGFQILNNIIRLVGLNGSYAFYVYAIILMIGVLSIINSYKNNWKYICLLIIPAIMLETSIHIRQGISFGVALIALSYIRKNKLILAGIFAFISFNIHKIIIIFFFILMISFILSKRKIPLHYIIILYTIATFIPQTINMDNYTHYLTSITFSNKYDGYIENADIWFSSDANNSIWQQSSYALLLSYLRDISMFIIINIALKIQENRELRYYFYAFVIGAIFIRFFFLNEILRRIFILPYMLFFIPVGYALTYVSNKKVVLPPIWNIIKTYCNCIIIIYFTLYWFRYIFFNKDCNFLWT